MKPLFFLALVVACGITCKPGWNDPLSTTPTASNPCGATYVPCLDMSGSLNGMCCGQHFTCGGGKFSSGCGPNECCFIGAPTGTYGAATSATVTKQITYEEAKRRP